MIPQTVLKRGLGEKAAGWPVKREVLCWSNSRSVYGSQNGKKGARSKFGVRRNPERGWIFLKRESLSLNY